jgi:hypothetical protein
MTGIVTSINNFVASIFWKSMFPKLLFVQVTKPQKEMETNLKVVTEFFQRASVYSSYLHELK